MNGDMVVYNMKKPMKWAVFKTMPDDLKKDYLEGIMERFGVSVREISEMLGVHFTSLYKVLKACDVDTSKMNSVRDECGFADWVNGGSFNKTEDVTVEETPVVEAPAELVEFKPMSWDEFKALSDDMKKEYIAVIRNRFNAPVAAIQRMFDIPRKPFRTVLDHLEMNPGKTCYANWDKEGFWTWVNGGTPESIEEVPFEDIPAVEEKECSIPEYKSPCYPESGSMVFEGRCEDVLRAVSLLLGGAKVHLNIMWDVLED